MKNLIDASLLKRFIIRKMNWSDLKLKTKEKTLKSEEMLIQTKFRELVTEKDSLFFYFDTHFMSLN